MRRARIDRRGFRAASGLTILEVMVALSIIAIAFLALAMAQITNLKATVRTQSVTDLKAAANNVLEERMAAVLNAADVGSEAATYYDTTDVYEYEDANGDMITQTRYLSFHFVDYYYSCPSVVSSPRTLRTVTCNGTVTQDGIDVDWSLTGRSGISGEGLVDIVVTAHNDGAELTIGHLVSCYEVYPSPSSQAPKPCPEPTTSGGGRPNA